MAEQLVRFNDNGLASPPPKLDCLPEPEHHRLMSDRNCFVDEHHLYFPRIKFDGHQDELVREFARHPFNRVSMPRCQHIGMHQRYNGAAIPPREVMASFLDEAAILTQLGVTVKALVDIEIALLTDDPKKAARNPDRYLERYDEFSAIRDCLALRARSTEIVPRRLALHGMQRIVPFTARFDPFTV